MNTENKNDEEIFKELKNDYGINLYDKILDLRKFEIENFWKRSLFFWGTIAIILASYFGAKVNPKFLVFVSLMGFLYNIIFSLSIRGSKYWQEHWETMAILNENELNFKLLKSETSTYISLGNKHFISFPHRFSVSKLTMLLSDLTTILWLLLWIKDIAYLINTHKIYFEFTGKTQIHLFTLYFLLTHVLLIGYFFYFSIKGKVYHKLN